MDGSLYKPDNDVFSKSARRRANLNCAADDVTSEICNCAGNSRRRELLSRRNFSSSGVRKETKGFVERVRERLAKARERFAEPVGRLIAGYLIAKTEELVKEEQEKYLEEFAGEEAGAA